MLKLRFGKHKGKALDKIPGKVVISFNLRLRYEEAEDCVVKIKKLGGFGSIVVGGSSYTGTKKQIDDLLVYMGKKEYDMGGMSINEGPREATQRRVDRLKKEGVI